MKWLQEWFGRDNKENPESARLLRLLLNGDELSLIDASIRAGADVNAKNEEGNTALLLAVEQSRHKDGWVLSVVKLLLENGAGPNINVTNAEGRSAISLALEIGSSEVVDFLLAHGAKCSVDQFVSYWQQALNERSDLFPALLKMLPNYSLVEFQQIKRSSSSEVQAHSSTQAFKKWFTEQLKSNPIEYELRCEDFVVFAKINKLNLSPQEVNSVASPAIVHLSSCMAQRLRGKELLGAMLDFIYQGSYQGVIPPLFEIVRNYDDGLVDRYEKVLKTKGTLKVGPYMDVSKLKDIYYYSKDFRDCLDKELDQIVQKKFWKEFCEKNPEQPDEYLRVKRLYVQFLQGEKALSRARANSFPVLESKKQSTEASPTSPVFLDSPSAEVADAFFMPLQMGRFKCGDQILQ